LTDCIAYLHKDRKSDFGVSFPDFPGCITAGRTLEEARCTAVETLSFHIAGMIEDDEKIPNPSTIDDVARDSALKGAVAFLALVACFTSAAIADLMTRRRSIQALDVGIPSGKKAARTRLPGPDVKKPEADRIRFREGLPHDARRFG
jgi:predicted RNase H-like HicB family nuclease